MPVFPYKHFCPAAELQIMVRKNLLVVFLFLLPTCWFAQTRMADSLIALLKTGSQDTVRANRLINLAMELVYNNENKKGMDYANEAMTLSKKLNFEKGIATCYRIYGRDFNDKSEYDKATEMFNESISRFTKIGLKRELATVYGDLGNTCYYKGIFHQSIENFLKALKILESLNEKADVAGYSMNIGIIYDKIGERDKAIEYYERSLKTSREIGHQQGIANAYANIAIVYSNKKELKKALEFHKKALQINETIKRPYSLWNAYFNVGSSFEMLGQNDSALIYIKKAEELSHKINNPSVKVRTQELLSMVYIKTGKNNIAEPLLVSDKKLLDSINSLELKSRNSLNFSNLYNGTGDYKKSLAYYKLYDSIEKEIFNDDNNRKVLQQQAEFAYEKKAVADSLKTVEERKIVAVQLEQERTQRIALYGGVGLLGLFGAFMFNRFRVTSRQKKVIEQKEKETDHQKRIIEEKHKEITDSINYAERIQRSFLATRELLDENLEDYFVFFKPKDVVSGDFYWASELSNGNFAYICADSTGHGVPGAIMSILNISSLERSIETKTNPAEIINETRKIIIERLKKDGSTDGGKDGMDASLIILNKEKNKLYYAAANNPVWILRDAQIIELDPDKMPIGKHDKDNQPFIAREFELKKGDLIYSLTDGFPDQFGGPKGKKYKYANMKNFLLSIMNLSMSEQKEKLHSEFESWRGSLEQVDDVCVIGVRI
ncbi:MAG: protein serine/threonine phosphatase [Bacteroidetes bacterium]|jgi:serine phosphatase RsbU (regulator of sigma subunit)/tetratricopeptide (TPR) repeat protein|nr:protein serine/threonine phosphatase [Bacteroidota bacterium]